MHCKGDPKDKVSLSDSSGSKDYNKDDLIVSSSLGTTSEFLSRVVAKGNKEDREDFVTNATTLE